MSDNASIADIPFYRHAIICCKWKFDGSISWYFCVYLAALAQK
uniref:Uncharacterized protein n=1 Tax=Yersinia enterocolitica W22703 TaxID=913028 RepID=F4N5S1_YEREN|nr:unknown protein [Yersinia enterocolitica W22703]